MNIPFYGYRYIGIQTNVCGNRPTILETRLEPRFIASYGSIEEAMKDFELRREEVEECHKFIKEYKQKGEN